MIQLTLAIADENRRAICIRAQDVCEIQQEGNDALVTYLVGDEVRVARVKENLILVRAEVEGRYRPKTDHHTKEKTHA